MRSQKRSTDGHVWPDRISDLAGLTLSVDLGDANRGFTLSKADMR